MDTCKNTQVVTGLQTTSQRVVDKLCSHCLFPVSVTSLEQAVHMQLSSWHYQTCYEVVLSSLIQ